MIGVKSVKQTQSYKKKKKKSFQSKLQVKALEFPQTQLQFTLSYIDSYPLTCIWNILTYCETFLQTTI